MIMLKVGLVGVGGISSGHIRCWNAMEDANLVALCDIRQERLDLYPDKRHYLDFEEMLEKEELDILDICLPSYMHADFAVKAMEHGLHVLTEKPLSLKTEDVERVYSTARKNNVNFMVAHVVRFWPEYIYLKKIYDTQQFGKLLSGRIWRLNRQPTRSWDGWMADEKRSGKAVFDLHIHDLDYLVYTFGKPKNTVARRLADRKDQDYVSIIYDYDDFFISAESSFYSGAFSWDAGYRFQFENALVVFEKSTIKIYHKDGTIQELSAADSGTDMGEVDLPKTDAYADEIRYFADCVKQNVFPDKIKQEEMQAILEIANSMQ